MAENCCAFWTLLLVRSCETAREATKRSDYSEANDIAVKYSRSFIHHLRDKCNLPGDKMEAKLDEAIGYIAEAATAHEETTFSKIGLSIGAEATFSKAAQQSFDSVISELENAVRERARELNCEL